jgi:predicted ferric reductase
MVLLLNIANKRTVDELYGIVFFIVEYFPEVNMAVLWMGGGLCCTCAVAAFTYLRSPRRPVTVNCHFCNTDHQVTVVENLLEFVISNHFY